MMNPKAQSAEKWLLRVATIVAAIVGLFVALDDTFQWKHDQDADLERIEETDAKVEAIAEWNRQQAVLFEREREEARAAKNLYERVNRGDLRVERVD